MPQVACERIAAHHVFVAGCLLARCIGGEHVGRAAGRARLVRIPVALRGGAGGCCASLSCQVVSASCRSALLYAISSRISRTATIATGTAQNTITISQRRNQRCCSMPSMPPFDACARLSRGRPDGASCTWMGRVAAIIEENAANCRTMWRRRYGRLEKRGGRLLQQRGGGAERGASMRVQRNKNAAPAEAVRGIRYGSAGTQAAGWLLRQLFMNALRSSPSCRWPACYTPSSFLLRHGLRGFADRQSFMNALRSSPVLPAAWVLQAFILSCWLFAANAGKPACRREALRLRAIGFSFRHSHGVNCVLSTPSRSTVQWR